MEEEEEGEEGEGEGEEEDKEESFYTHKQRRKMIKVIAEPTVHLKLLFIF